MAKLQWILCATAILTIPASASATSCVDPSERLTLTLEGVTHDGEPQPLDGYEAYRVVLEGPPPEVELIYARNPPSSEAEPSTPFNWTYAEHYTIRFSVLDSGGADAGR